MKYYHELNICAKHLAWELEMRGCKVGNHDNQPNNKPSPLPKILNRGCLIELTRQDSYKKHKSLS